MYSVRYRPQVATLALQRWCCSLAFPVGERSWRTRRMARRRSIAPLSLSRFKMAVLPRQQRNGKGGVKTFHRRLRLFLCSKIEDSHHQFGLQPFPNVVVYTKINISTLVI